MKTPVVKEKAETPYVAPMHGCPLCPSSFKAKRDRDRHVRVVHEKRRDFQCPRCPKRFGEASGMRRHIRCVHDKIRAHKVSHARYP